MTIPFLILLLLETQADITLTAKGSFPACQEVRVISPNGKWALVSTANQEFCSKAEKKGNAVFERELFLVNESNQWKRVVMEYNSSGDVNWASDSSAFFVNDQVASNEGDAYIFSTASLSKLDLTEAIFRSDSSTAKVKYGHRYVIARKWMDNGAVLVQLCGHTDDAPVVQFDFRYRVNVTGQVQRLTQKKGPPDREECIWDGK